MQNYQKALDSVIDRLNGSRPALLLHSCCGPCSSYCIEYLSEYFEVTVFYYNPNIHPEQEYIKRLETQKKIVSELGLASLEVGEYDSSRYFELVKGHECDLEGGDRCAICFRQRLLKTAKTAAEHKFPWFCSTLTVSPHKNSAVINQIGETLGKEYDVRWLPSDFKKREGYKRSLELSKQYGLYRQNYCGCIFSKR